MADPEARLIENSDTVEFTAGAALASGELLQHTDGRALVVQGSGDGFASGALATGAVRGKFALASASGTTFSIGDSVYWDVSATQAVGPALTADGSADFYAGVATKAKTSGQTVVEVDLNVSYSDGPRPIVFEFDCQTGVDTAAHVLIPAEQNPHGLLITDIYAVVTEVFAGTEDQGIVTVSDESDNALATLTATDSGADAVDDIIVGYALGAASTGDAGLVVAAGEYVDAAVTQVTTGSAAGKMKVYVRAIPLV